MRSRLLWIGLPFALLVLIAAAGGPDCLRYLDWARAVRAADLGELGGTALSPLGLPVSQWSHGPGLLFSIPQMLPWPYGWVPAELLGPLDDFRLIGWLAALAIGWGLFRMLRQLLGPDVPLTLFVAGAAFTGTHLGYYSTRHASESLALAGLALIGAWLVTPRRWRVRDVLFVSTACALLVVVRAQLLPYVLLALGMLTYRWATAERRGRGAWLGYALLVGLPLASAVTQVGWVNRWMTGSWLRSPYVFGDDAFKSFDWLDPEILAVLFHPWHGWFVYHPLYAIAIGLLVVGAVRATSPAERWLHVGAGVAVAGHVYLQASWYVWWLGVGTFGMRGLAPTAMVLVPVLAHALARRIRAGRPVTGLGVAIVAASCWSFLLLMQGMTNFVTYAELLQAQVATLVRLEVFLPLVVAIAMGAAAMRGETDRARRGWIAGAAFFATLAAWYLTGEVIGGAAAIGLRLPVAALLGWLCGRLARPCEREARSGLAEPAVAAVGIAIFVVTSGLFARLAFHTERLILYPGDLETPRAPISVDLDEVEESYGEYRRVPGFEDKKTALGEYLRRAGRTVDDGV